MRICCRLCSQSIMLQCVKRMIFAFDETRTLFENRIFHSIQRKPKPPGSRARPGIKTFRDGLRCV
jgi:hypothetical protein